MKGLEIGNKLIFGYIQVRILQRALTLHLSWFNAHLLTHTF